MAGMKQSLSLGGGLEDFIVVVILVALQWIFLKCKNLQECLL
jgi:hypothetical protein